MDQQSDAAAKASAISQVKFDGFPIKMGDKWYVFPPLSFKRLKAILPRLSTVSMPTTVGKMEPEMADMITEIALASLARNYPDMTAETLEDLIDMGNMMPILNAVMNISGLAPKDAKPGEADAQ